MTDCPGGEIPAHPDRLSADPNIGTVRFTAEQLRHRIAELGAEITEDYSGRPPLLVGVLRGASMFHSDLARAIDLPLDIDYIAVSSYGSAARTSGVVRVVKELDEELSGRHVILVEDIVDTGLTLRYLRRNLAARGPASLEVCALLARNPSEAVSDDVAYIGFEIADEAFVIGYGLDVGQRYRNLGYIADYAGPDRR